MDAKELMIGDWVRYKKNYPDEKLGGIIARVLGISNFIMVRTTGEKYDDVNPDWLEPIPLTSKILEKNGFKKVDTQRYDLEDPIVGYHINVNPKREFIHINSCIMGNCNLYPTDINVHTFQHALRLCGLGNLADNFQV